MQTQRTPGADNEKTDVVSTTEALETEISTLADQMTELSACMEAVADGFAEFTHSPETTTETNQTRAGTTGGQPTAGD